MSTVKPNELGVSQKPAGDGRDAQWSDPTNADVLRQNVAVVQGTYAAVGRGDIPALLGLLTDDVEWTLQGPAVIPFARTRHGREAVAEFFAQVGETIEFLQFEPRDFVAQGDTVVVLGYERNLISPQVARSSKSGHMSTRSGTARSPGAGFLKTQRHTLPRSTQAKLYQGSIP